MRVSAVANTPRVRAEAPGVRKIDCSQDGSDSVANPETQACGAMFHGDPHTSETSCVFSLYPPGTISSIDKGAVFPFGIWRRIPEGGGKTISPSIIRCLGPCLLCYNGSGTAR